MCVLLDTRSTISAVYLKLYYEVKSGNVGEIVFNSDCFNSDLGNSCLLTIKLEKTTFSTQLYEIK